MSDIKDTNPENYVQIQKIEHAPNTIVVASFNMERLGQYHKDYNALADIVKQFDLVGCIEVVNPDGVKELVDAMGDPKWKYYVSKENTGTQHYKEYFAYIWDSTKIDFIIALGFYNDTNNEFARDPFGCMFRAGKLDFTFVILHIVFGKNMKDREAEISHLDEVYKYFEIRAKGDRDIIIAGDFNDGNSKDFSKLEEDDNIVDVVPQGEKTTIGQKGLASNYDHIFVSKYTKGDFVVANEDDYVKSDNFIYDKKNVSDHVPVYFVLKTDSDEDKTEIK